MKKKHRLLRSDLCWGCLAAVLVILQFWWLPGEHGAAADSWSTSVDGKLGLYRLLTELFPRVERDSLSPVPQQPCTLLLIAPERYPTAGEQQQLYEFVYHGGQLLFAPRRTDPAIRISSLGIDIDAREVSLPSPGTVPTPSVLPPAPPGTGTAAEEESPTTPGANDILTGSPDTQSVPSEQGTEKALTSAADNSADSSGQPQTAGGSLPAAGEATEEESADLVTARGPLVSEPVQLHSGATLSPPRHLEFTTLLESDTNGPEICMWNLGAGRVVACSGADIFSNRSLLFPEQQRLAVRVVESCRNGGHEATSDLSLPIVVSEYFNASAAFHQTGILFSPALRIGMLQLLLAAVLGVWLSFHRFGPAAPESTLPRRSLTENAEAVGNLQFRTRDGGTIVANYLDYLRSRLRQRYGSQVRLDQPESIARRTGATVESVRAQLDEAQRMTDSHQLSTAKAAAMLRWLAQLQHRLCGDHRPGS